MALSYNVDLIPDGDTVRVECPDLPGVNTFGDDDDEALMNSVDAIIVWLKHLMDERKDIPAPRYKGGQSVHMSILTSLKVDLYRAMRAKGIRKADLAKMLRMHPPQAARLLDLDHASRVEQLEAAFQAIGMRAEADVKEAA
jgi:antitoxin HicB